MLQYHHYISLIYFTLLRYFSPLKYFILLISMRWELEILQSTEIFLQNGISLLFDRFYSVDISTYIVMSTDWKALETRAILSAHSKKCDIHHTSFICPKSKQGRIHGYRSRVQVGRGYIWGHGPFRQEQWAKKNKIIKKVNCDRPTNPPTDHPTDRQTDKVGCRVV